MNMMRKKLVMGVIIGVRGFSIPSSQSATELHFTNCLAIWISIM